MAAMMLIGKKIQNLSIYKSYFVMRYSKRDVVLDKDIISDLRRNCWGLAAI
jgi:hypothetical protein